MADFSLFCLGSLLSLQTAAWTALAEGDAPAPPPPHSLLSNHFLAGALRSLPTLEIVCVCPRSVHFCRNLVSCSPLYWQDVDVRSVGGNKRTTQQQLRTVQRVWALPIRLRLSGCVSSGKLFHFSGLWAPHLKSRLRGPTG